jgi:hypothetical protein
MTPTAFRLALAALGMSASSYAAMTGRPRNTVIAWTDDRRGGPPQPDAEWIARRLAALRSDPPPRVTSRTDADPSHCAPAAPAQCPPSAHRPR